MVVVSAAMPDTSPVSAPIVAAAVLVLVHVPPPNVLLKVVVLPMHTDLFPVIAVGTAYTVSVIVAIQPAPVVYWIEAVPAATPVARPVVSPMDATAVFVLFQVPPEVASFNVVVFPAHTDTVPVIGASGLTVTVVAAVQPADVV